MQDLEDCKGLCGYQVRVVDCVEDGGEGHILGVEEGAVDGVGGPEGEVEGVVGEEVDSG